MISVQTILKIGDNSGAKTARCIKTFNTNSNIGDTILISIKTLRTKTKLKERLKIKKGSIFKALIIRASYKTKNMSNNFIKFDNNSVILLNNNNQPVATRILGPITRSLRKKKNLKVLSIASNIV